MVYDIKCPICEREYSRSELEIMDIVDAMCTELLDPETAGKWEDVKTVLFFIRRDLKDTAEGKRMNSIPSPLTAKAKEVEDGGR